MTAPPVDSGAGSEAIFEQGMAGGLEAEEVGGEDGGDTVEVAGEAGAGEEAVDESEDASAVDEGLGEDADLASEGDKDAMDFSLFFFEEADELVVLLDGFEGFDVDGLAGRAGAMNDAGDAALELRADGDDEAVAANGDEVFLGGAVGGELAEGGAEGLFDDALLTLLVAADAVKLGRGVVGEGAVGLDGALDGFGQGAETGGERGRALGEAGELAGEAGGGRLEQGLPGGDVVGEAGDGLELGGFEGCAGDAGFVGYLGRVEEAAERDGDLFAEQEAEFGDELVLGGDPGLVRGGPEGEDGLAADRRARKASNQSKEKIPLEGGGVGVLNGRRDGIEEGHGATLILAVGWIKGGVRDALSSEGRRRGRRRYSRSGDRRYDSRRARRCGLCGGT